MCGKAYVKNPPYTEYTCIQHLLDAGLEATVEDTVNPDDPDPMWAEYCFCGVHVDIIFDRNGIEYEYDPTFDDYILDKPLGDPT